MARVAGAARVLLPVLDILQSIPVLGFLPGFVLGLVHLFPHQNFLPGLGSYRSLAIERGDGRAQLLGVRARYVHLLMALTGDERLHLLRSTAATFVRVVTAVALASLWTIPVGVMMARQPRWSRVLQPVIQMAASFPAPMIFPVVVGGMLAFGVGLGISSVGLLLLGTQWYILFNVIAGSSAIPRELWEVSRLARALAVEPEILCMDEPFSALDVLTSGTRRNEVIDLYTQDFPGEHHPHGDAQHQRRGLYGDAPRGESTLVLPR